MGKRTSYEPGAFCWVELRVDDPGTARSFYSGLFGWEPESNGDYTLFRSNGDPVCGLLALTEEMRTAGVQPSWSNFVTVADAGAGAELAKELGGTVLHDPLELDGLGRTTVLGDPQGAELSLWQPGDMIGAERVNDPGCLCMNELATGDVEGACAFYERLFGWRTEVVEPGPDGPQVVFAYNDETLNASISPAAEGEASHWRPYFTVESTEVAWDRVLELGGEEVLAPTESSDGSIAIARDLQGADFGLFAGEVDP